MALNMRSVFGGQFDVVSEGKDYGLEMISLYYGQIVLSLSPNSNPLVSYPHLYQSRNPLFNLLFV